MGSPERKTRERRRMVPRSAARDAAQNSIRAGLTAGGGGPSVPAASRRRSTSPTSLEGTSMLDRRVGVGVIGTGFARTTQIPAFQALAGVEVVAILSRSLTRAYDLAREFGLRRAFDD